MFCENCGKDLGINGKFCKSCKIDYRSEKTDINKINSEQYIKKNKKFFTFSMIFILIYSIISIILSMSQDKFKIYSFLLGIFLSVIAFGIFKFYFKITRFFSMIMVVIFVGSEIILVRIIVRNINSGSQFHNLIIFFILFSLFLLFIYILINIIIKFKKIEDLLFDESVFLEFYKYKKLWKIKIIKEA